MSLDDSNQVATVRSKNPFLIFTWVRNRFSDEMLDKILQGMKPEHREKIEAVDFSSDDVPVVSYQNMLEVLSTLISNEEFLECADHFTQTELEGSHKFVMEDLSQDGIIKRMYEMWSIDFNQGIPRLLVVSDEMLKMQVEDFPTNPAHAIFLSQCIKRYAERAIGGKYTATSEILDETTTNFTFVKVEAKEEK